jgi:predicted TIM-barrel fold metal-dependent hydrolase
MFIGIHGHAYRHPTYPRYGKLWVTPEKLVEFYDLPQIERGVLMPMIGPDFYLSQSNEVILEAAEKFPGRFIPFCNVKLRDDGKISEMVFRKVARKNAIRILGL